MAEHFTLSENNPNDGIGGGGCLCGDLRDEDRVGPFAIFPAVTTDCNLSPFAVLCAGCARSVVKAVDGGAEVLNAGERGEPDPAPPEAVVPEAYAQTGVSLDDDDELVL